MNRQYPYNTNQLIGERPTCELLIKRRGNYLTKYTSDWVNNIYNKIGIQYNSRGNGNEPTNYNWGTLEFHLNNRITKIEDLLSARPETISNIGRYYELEKSGYRINILPLNLLSPIEVLNQFLPPLDYCDTKGTQNIDPYGIATLESKIIDQETGYWIGSRKFDHTLLFNIHGTCPIGCSDCYKSYYTREGHQDELGFGKLTGGKEFRQYLSATVDWLNSNEEVFDVIVSGGEPLIRKNSQVKLILDAFSKARHVRILRICTGTIFLGLPFRIDDELVGLLKDFESRTSKRVTIQAHLSNHLQFTPEALMAIHKITNAGIKIYSQVPIREGVNFFSNDIDKTIDFWVKLGHYQSVCGVEPYMFIVDMHPSTLAYYVPIEQILKVWNLVYESHDYPGLEKPRTLSILCKEGNILLSGHSLLSMKKRIDRKKGIVMYLIPHMFNIKADANSIGRMFTYEEPLVEANANPHSLSNLQKEWTKLAKDN